MILPLLDENLDPASAHELRISIAEKNDIPERTVRRYVSIYRKKDLTDSNLQNVHTIVKITNRKTMMNYLRMPVL